MVPSNASIKRTKLKSSPRRRVKLQRGEQAHGNIGLRLTRRKIIRRMIEVGRWEKFEW